MNSHILVTTEIYANIFYSDKESERNEIEFTSDCESYGGGYRYLLITI